jgi:hypothetical protein
LVVWSLGDAIQQRPVGHEHIVQHPRRKHLLDGVPHEDDLAILLIDLMVEPRLRRLADPEVHAAE